MKKVLGALLFASSAMLFSGVSLADADAAWINKCKNEIDNEGNSPEVVNAWCSCMNGEMDVNETLSILAWYKTPAGAKADEKCEKSSGWKSKQ